MYSTATRLSWVGMGATGHEMSTHQRCRDMTTVSNPSVFSRPFFGAQSHGFDVVQQHPLIQDRPLSSCAGPMSSPLPMGMERKGIGRDGAGHDRACLTAHSLPCNFLPPQPPSCGRIGGSPFPPFAFLHCSIASHLPVLSPSYTTLVSCTPRAQPQQAPLLSPAS